MDYRTKCKMQNYKFLEDDLEKTWMTLDMVVAFSDTTLKT